MYYINNFNTRRTKLSINIYHISDLTQMLKILEKLEKMTNYGAEVDPHYITQQEQNRFIVLLSSSLRRIR
jgi:hypothetical protein